MATPAGFENKVAFLWRIADKLRGDFKQHEYGAIMLPTLVLFRLDAVLAKTKQAVVERAKTLDLTSPTADPLLRRAAGGLAFYNTSPLTMQAMLSDDKNIAAQLQTYVAGFSPEASRVLDAFNYQQTITKLDRAGVLYQVLGDFADVDLHPSTVSNEAMGYIFEELLRKFSEMSNETAGEHYTPREVIRLMVDLLFDEDADALAGQAPVRTVYDPAAGTGGMLTVAEQRMKELNPNATVSLFGQELNPETWATPRSELMMRGETPEQLAPGNSLADDAFPERTFDYILANPPYGVDWKKYADPIRSEAARGSGRNRFSAGLPRVSDGSFLFLQHMISKMKPHSAAGGGSRIAIVLSGSPLFSGGAGSGESEIRRWIIENDWLEGIVGLPDQMFYNTGISTYVWIVTNRKPEHGRGTVTLVDARDMGSKMRKSLGDKRKELSGESIDEIARLFADFEADDRRVKVLRNEEFGFARLTVERPLRPMWRMEAALPSLPEDLAVQVESLKGGRWGREVDARQTLVKTGLGPKQITVVLKAAATTDPDAEPVKAKKGGGYESDPELRDQESIPLPAGYLDLDPDAKAAAVCAAAEQHLRDEISPPRLRRLDRPQQDQDRLRNPLHPPLLRLHTTSSRRRNPGRNRRARTPYPGVDAGIGAVSTLRLRHVVTTRVQPATGERRVLNLESMESGSGRISNNLPEGPTEQGIRFEPGDVVFSKLRPYLAKAIIGEPLDGTGELLAMVPSQDTEPRYLLYLTLSKPWLDYSVQTSYGTKMPRTSWEALADHRVPDFGLVQQRQIADFLDDQVARIDNIIAARTEQARLVIAERHSRVHFAVTGGYAAHRLPSRLAWATTIPDHWASVRLCQVARIGTGHTPSRSKPENWIHTDVPWLTTSDVYRFRFDQIDAIDDTDVHISRIGLENSSAVTHPAGTVGLSRTSASAGFAIYMTVPMATSQDFATWTPGPLVDGMYLLWCLRSMHHDLMGRLAMGSTHKTIYFPELMSVRIPLPPRPEQEAIVESIQHAADAARRHSSALTRSVELLTDLKRSLITAAVSGEFDVSSADGSRVRV